MDVRLGSDAVCNFSTFRAGSATEKIAMIIDSIELFPTATFGPPELQLFLLLMAGACGHTGARGGSMRLARFSETSACGGRAEPLATNRDTSDLGIRERERKVQWRTPPSRPRALAHRPAPSSANPACLSHLSALQIMKQCSDVLHNRFFRRINAGQIAQISRKMTVDIVWLIDDDGNYIRHRS
jgi:hypothetical protein